MYIVHNVANSENILAVLLSCINFWDLDLCQALQIDMPQSAALQNQILWFSLSSTLSFTLIVSSTFN